MLKYLKLRVIGSLLTLVYIIMVFASIGEGFRNGIIITAIILFFVSGIIEMKNKNANIK